ncbi:MAG: hypothetical protein IID31_12235 [Planctomycetes bacterium]|nr:hypothetical protein [Planctomycetota bacterium]
MKLHRHQARHAFCQRRFSCRRFTPPHGFPKNVQLSPRLARLAGRGDALALILTGEPIDAAHALRIGIVSEVVAKAALTERADAIAGRIAERGPIAVQYAKEAVSRGAEMPLEQGLRYETDLTMILQTTEDRAEGVRAFLEKRQPKFKGK